MASLENLMSGLRERKPAPAIALIGDDSYLRKVCRDAIMGAYVEEGAREWALFRFSVRDSGWDGLFERAQTPPMLSSRQVLFAEDVDSVERLGDDARDEITATLGKYLMSPAPFTVMVLEAESLDKRLKFGKLLTSNKNVVFVELNIGGEAAVALAAQMAKNSGAEIDSDAAALLADILNSEPARMSVEIEKLATYAGTGGRITTKDVEALVKAARRNTVWQLADLIAERRSAAALELLANLLREGEPPPMIVGALAFRYRMLIEGRAPQPSWNYRTQGQFGLGAGLGGGGARPSRALSRKELLAGLVALAEADSALKSSNPDHRATLEFLITQLAAPSAPSVSVVSR